MRKRRNLKGTFDEYIQVPIVPCLQPLGRKRPKGGKASRAQDAVSSSRLKAYLTPNNLHVLRTFKDLCKEVIIRNRR